LLKNSLIITPEFHRNLIEAQTAEKHGSDNKLTREPKPRHFVKYNSYGTHKQQQTTANNSKQQQTTANSKGGHTICLRQTSQPT
jgi:hypothetical protein